jgi:hypothetical protein
MHLLTQFLVNLAEVLQLYFRQLIDTIKKKRHILIVKLCDALYIREVTPT